MPQKEYQRAFLMCKKTTIGGFNDWRLPKNNELTFLYKNGKKYLSKSNGYYLDEFTTNFFLHEEGSVCYNFIDGETVKYYRGNYYKVRAVRNF